MASHDAELKCPACSGTLQQQEFDDATKELERNISKRFGEQSRKRKQEFDDKISELKASHRKDLQNASKKHQIERKALQKRLVEQISKSKEIRERELRDAKKNYQMQLENIRSIYQSQAEETKNIFDQIVSNNQMQNEKLQKWLHEQLVDEPFTKIAKIEQEKKSVEQQVASLVQQLNDKNAEMILLREKIKQLEEKVPAEARDQVVEENAMDSKYQNIPEGPEDSQQKEWLDMIKELAHQHEIGEDGPEEEVEPRTQEQQKTWGSKVAKKKFGLF